MKGASKVRFDTRIFYFKNTIIKNNNAFSSYRVFELMIPYFKLLVDVLYPLHYIRFAYQSPLENI